MPTASSSIHVWYRCYNCGAEPIVGRRYDCRTCPAGPDNHLCDRCYAQLQVGAVKHPLPTSFAAYSAIRRHEFVAVDGQGRESVEGWVVVPDCEAAPPRVPDLFVVRPEFISGHASYWGSYACLADPGDGAALVLTALHVLDELAKAANVDCSVSNATYSGAELPRLVDRVTLYDVFAENWMLAEVGSAGPMLILPDARIREEEPYSQRDVAAFAGTFRAPLSPAALAASSPGVGEPLWLASALPGGRRAQPAVVVERTERTLVYRFAHAGKEGVPKFTSGAPLLNYRGEVVGINVGGGCLDGRRYGHASHVESIRRHLGIATTVADAAVLGRRETGKGVS